jgi:hypothetical protein
MPKVTCTCGYIHNLSPIPDDGWIIIKDAAYETMLLDELESREGDDIAAARASSARGRMYECPECGRLMLSRPGDRCTRFEVFKPESD